MRTEAQEMQLQQPFGGTRSKEKAKPKPRVAIREPLDPNRVLVKVNGHLALVLIDLQTIGGDLISAQFVYLYKLPVVKIEPKTLVTAIKGSKATADKTCKVELNWGGYQETRMFCIAHLSGGDMILGKSALLNVRTTIPAGTATVSIQLASINRFYLCMRRGN